MYDHMSNGVLMYFNEYYLTEMSLRVLMYVK